jgi:hypothetical protein
MALFCKQAVSQNRPLAVNLKGSRSPKATRRFASTTSIAYRCPGSVHDRLGGHRRFVLPRRTCGRPAGQPPHGFGAGLIGAALLEGLGLLLFALSATTL